LDSLLQTSNLIGGPCYLATILLQQICIFIQVSKYLVYNSWVFNADNKPTRLKKMNVRFTAPVYPGEIIRTEIWCETDSAFAFSARVLEHDI